MLAEVEVPRKVLLPEKIPGDGVKIILSPPQGGYKSVVPTQRNARR
jgi:hypothetical protein